MVYTRMGKGTVVIGSKIDSGDVVTKCDCGGDIVAMDLDEDDDVVACCDECADWSEWLHEEPEALSDDEPAMLTNVVSLNERRLACLRV